MAPRINLITEPTVTLLSYTPNPELTVATAARICYSHDSIAHLNETLTDKQVEHLINIIIKNGHGTPLEHATFTFGVDGVSRAATHQLVRHRLASFDEKSQRYVRFDESVDVIVPPSVAEHDFTMQRFKESQQRAFEDYRYLVEHGIEPEDARYVLTHAGVSNIVMSMNARQWRHVLSLRCCNRAQWEIRRLMWIIRDQLIEKAPLLFADSGPGCVRGACPEGSMSCGNPYPRIK